MAAHKVIWREGMLLRPQHLQQNDRYYEQQIKARTSLLGRYCWGFFEQQMDEEALGNGKLILSRASGVLPDGTLFDLGNRREPLVADVPPGTTNTPVYLALPLATGNHIEARRPEQVDVMARYLCHGHEVADSNAGDHGSTQVICAEPDFRLLLGEQGNDPAYVRLKLCEVLDTSPNGRVTLASEFIPTYLHFHASGYLLACLKEVIGLLGHRGDALAERLQSSGKAGGAEVGDFLMLQLINRTEPLLQHCLAQEQVHPEEVYRTLLALLGELATFASDNKRAPAEMQYRHNDQGASFRQLMEGIRQRLAMVLERHAIELPLEGRGYGVVAATLHDRQLLDNASFVLAASAQCETELLRQRLPVHLKAGTMESIRELVNLHLPGIRIRPLPVAPRQIPFHANKTYFVLEPSAEQLAQLQGTSAFAFHVTDELPGLELTFWAIRN